MRDKCANLLQTLRVNFERILQPHAVKPPENNYLHWPSEEIKMIAEREEFQLYSDDLFFRIYCAEDRPNVMVLCTLDIISALVDSGALAICDAAQKIATLCSWKVGISIEPRYVAYAIPASVDKAKSLNEAIKFLRADANAMAVLNRIWDPAKSFQESLAGASVLLSHIIQAPSTSPNKMASVMDIWCAKAKLRTDSEGPIDNIALLVASTAMRLAETDADFSAQLRSVYFALVEMEHGDKMDERKEKDAIVALGYMSAEIDVSSGLEGGRRLRVKIGAAFTPGTSEEEAFLRGYANASQDTALKTTQKQ